MITDFQIYDLSVQTVIVSYQRSRAKILGISEVNLYQNGRQMKNKYDKIFTILSKKLDFDTFIQISTLLLEVNVNNKHIKDMIQSCSSANKVSFVEYELEQAPKMTRRQRSIRARKLRDRFRLIRGGKI